MPKNHPKNTSSIFMLWAQFSIFSVFVPSIFSNFGSILGALGLHFSMFFEIPVLLSFLYHIFINFRKTEKVKSAQNTAPVHGFKASPGWKDRAHLWKKCGIVSIIVSSKIDENSIPKVRKSISLTKIDKALLPGAPFGAKKRLLVDSWRLARSPKNAKSRQSGEKL